MADNKEVLKRLKPGFKKTLKSKQFPIVAIGASAGGLEAFMSLLQKLPANTGMAYVYIQHLDPTHKSLLSKILARHTKMKVMEAKHLLPLKVNHVYVIPPNKNMTVDEGILTLNPREVSSSPQMPIDTFFISLADEGAIGIVLSGSAKDGTLGLKSIKAAGGFTIAQDDSAKFQSMPKSAIAEGVVDMVLPPDKIAEELTRISQNKNFIQRIFSEEELATKIDVDFTAIIELLHKSTGTDFSHYKINTIQRRIIRRMLLMKLETLKEYHKYLKKHNSEVQVLYSDLLINVTSFFRDPDALEYVKKTILPKIIKSKKANESLRIWIPACSTGEEAYSLAMILHEIMGEHISNLSIQIFASDLSDTAIHKARIGLYSKSDMGGISSKRLQRFFIKADNGYRIIKSIRDLCVFAPHNVLRDPPFSRLDLISCCNLMIYLDTTLQKKILHIFHYSLHQYGFLLLGKSETIASAGELFNQIEKKYKVFSKKKESANHARFQLKFPTPDRENKVVITKPELVKQSVTKVNQLEKTVEDILLRKFTPAGVVVNEDLEILHFRGSTGLYLEPAPGKASLNLLKMAKPGLAYELRNAIHKSRKSLALIRKPGIEIKVKGHLHLVSVEVVPLNLTTDEQLFLVVFEEAMQGIPAETKSSLTRDKIIKQLEHELEASKEDMRSMLEEQEAQVEELQSANEEIVSSNEELQSINEELETSKEEIESANEELATINNELLTSNEQLFEANEYAETVFDTIREAVILLDKKFRVINANKSFYRIFGVSEQDTEGTLIYELGNREWDTYQLRQLLEDVIPKNAFFNEFEVDNEFPKIGRKIMLLNARRVQKNNGQFGILLAIEDITEHRHAQQLLRERESWFRNMSNHAPVMIWVAGTDKNKSFFNTTWLEYTGREHSEDKSEWKKEIHSDDLPHYMEVFNKHVDLRIPFRCEYRLKRTDGMYRWIVEAAKPTFTQEGAFTGYIGSCTEIHDRKLILEELERLVNQRTHDLQQTNEALQRSNNELQQFAYVASHDLQEPLRKILTFADRLYNTREQLPASALSFIEKISNSSERMRKLIDELLNFSRITLKDHKYVSTNLESVLESVLSDFEVVITEKKADIYHDPLPTIEAVPVQMEQLLHNMISNGLKFARKDTPSVIRITSHTVDRQELLSIGLEESVPYVKIVFADNGIGFSPEYAEQIFDIFHRLNHKQDYPGTGIGLALCRRIVSNHGGKIVARGTENEGAEFHVFLPVNQGEKHADNNDTSVQ